MQVTDFLYGLPVSCSSTNACWVQLPSIITKRETKKDKINTIKVAGKLIKLDPTHNKTKRVSPVIQFIIRFCLFFLPKYPTKRIIPINKKSRKYFMNSLKVFLLYFMVVLSSSVKLFSGWRI